MGTREPKSREWWEEETHFIERESKSAVRMGGYASYCHMQQKFCREDGFDDLADRICAALKEAS